VIETNSAAQLPILRRKIGTTARQDKASFDEERSRGATVIQKRQTSPGPGMMSSHPTFIALKKGKTPIHITKKFSLMTMADAICEGICTPGQAGALYPGFQK
jgi:hypothetical protein